MSSDIVTLNPLSASKANISIDDYQRQYNESIEDFHNFWAEKAKQLNWYKPFEHVYLGDFAKGKVEWFAGGTLNVCDHCLDRHVAAGHGDKTALIWQGDQEQDSKTYTYQELLDQVSHTAEKLKSLDLVKGDRVIIYLPMIPELAFTVLACARLGLVHSVIFAGFSAKAIQSRIEDCQPRVVVTADGGFRGGKIIPLKSLVDSALEKSSSDVESVLVVKRSLQDVYWDSSRDVWWHETTPQPPQNIAPPVPCHSEDPLFILYTSGSTGQPKGILHTQAGYLLNVMMTFHDLLDHKPDDVYWCTADIGWITGHSYLLYGPLANAATTVMFEGTPTYPTAGRCWEIVDKYNVTVFYTAPTAIRMLMREGDSYVKKYDRSSLRILGTVGEPINPEAWKWYYNTVGDSRCPVIDTWWQTETGSHMLAPLPAETKIKPGAATRPYLGVLPVLLDNDGKELTGPATGKLCIKNPWPSMARGIYGNPSRFYDVYFSPFSGYYFTGDLAQRDENGDWWIIGRADDVLNVSGHRIGTAELESALVGHPEVTEAAVVGVEDDIKGQAIYAYITLTKDVLGSEKLQKELNQEIVESIGKIAKVEYFHWTSSLPKTRSGKIMRRILRKIANNDTNDLGDTSTLADSNVIESLLQSYNGKNK